MAHATISNTRNGDRRSCHSSGSYHLTTAMVSKNSDWHNPENLYPAHGPSAPWSTVNHPTIPSPSPWWSCSGDSTLITIWPLPRSPGDLTIPLLSAALKMENLLALNWCIQIVHRSRSRPRIHSILNSMWLAWSSSDHLQLLERIAA